MSTKTSPIRPKCQNAIKTDLITIVLHFIKVAHFISITMEGACVLLTFALFYYKAYLNFSWTFFSTPLNRTSYILPYCITSVSIKEIVICASMWWDRSSSWNGLHSIPGTWTSQSLSDSPSIPAVIHHLHMTAKDKTYSTSSCWDKSWERGGAWQTSDRALCPEQLAFKESESAAKNTFKQIKHIWIWISG